VPDVTNINPVIEPELNWASRLGASCLPSVGFPGTSVPVAGPVTAPPTLTRVRGKVAVMAQLEDQTTVHNYMTSIFTGGEGASGPAREPRDRGPA
jgi:hypothetical protein